MKQIKIFILLFTIATTTNSCAQTGFIKSVQAYTAERKMGQRPVNLEGEEIAPKVDSFIHVYIETSVAKPSWQNAWRLNKPYNVIASQVKGPLDIGINTTTNKRVVVKAKPGNQLWLLELIPSNEKLLKPVKASSNNIILQGRNNNKPFNVKVNKLIALETPDAA